VGEAVHEHARVLAVLRSRRYLGLRAALDQIAADPPWTDRAEERAKDVLPPLVHRDGKRVRRRIRRGDDPHEVRKAAKRLRYAYELVEPVWGRRATRPREAAEELTTVLGDRQDGLVAREWLVVLASEALRTGDSAFTLGRLHALEEQREVEQLEAALRAWRRLDAVRW
jgi:CHAD domain-containing protein